MPLLTQPAAIETQNSTAATPRLGSDAPLTLGADENGGRAIVQESDLSQQATQKASRYAVSVDAVRAGLKANLGWLFTGILLVVIELALDFIKSKQISPPLVLGYALDALAFYTFMAHAAQFKGQSRRAWWISWLVRFALLYASFGASEMAKHHTWTWEHHWLGALLIASGSIWWQRRKQAKIEKSRR